MDGLFGIIVEEIVRLLATPTRGCAKQGGFGPVKLASCLYLSIADIKVTYIAVNWKKQNQHSWKTLQDLIVVDTVVEFILYCSDDCLLCTLLGTLYIRSAGLSYTDPMDKRFTSPLAKKSALSTR